LKNVLQWAILVTENVGFSGLTAMPSIYLAKCQLHSAKNSTNGLIQTCLER